MNRIKTISSLESLSIFARSKVLIIMPHPDDEAVFLSGLLYRLKKHGIKRRVIVMTRGERSTKRYGVKVHENLGFVRKKELEKVFRLLQIDNYKIYSFPDGELENQEIAAKKVIKDELDGFKPTHVITFEPSGVYGHPDHIALSIFVQALVKEPVKLLYTTVPQFKIKPQAAKMAKQPVSALPPEYKLKLNWLDRIQKFRALNSHKSQFRFSATHPKDFIFLVLNGLAGGEYFTYR